jgi:outer membrane protein TolC
VLARGTLAMARAETVPLLGNPELEVGAGQRGDRLELEASLMQPLARGPGARRAVADAEIAGATARVDAELQRVRLEAGLAFVRALAAEERLGLARRAEALAGELQSASERRLARGDALALDVEMATAARARAKAARHAAEADRESSLGELRARTGLGADTPLRLTGDLAPRALPAAARLVDETRRAPELRALAAEARGADAVTRLGHALGWPELQVGASVAREGDETIWLARLGVTLPFFSRGQSERARGRALGVRARAAESARTKELETRLFAALAAHARLAEAAAAVDEGRLGEVEAQLARAYEVGRLGVVEYLAARRELEETRLAAIERRLALAEATLAIEAVLP